MLKTKIVSILLGIVLVLVIVGCGPVGSSDIDTPTENVLGETQTITNDPPQASASPTVASPETTETDLPAEPTQAPTLTPTPDTRPLPEDWRSWPVVPDLPDHLVDLYWSGIDRGNDPTHFSKVGDCQLIPVAFFGVYDIPGGYTLGEQYAYLQETIDQFAGSFGREGYSLKGGMNFPAVFSPLRADPTACLPGETPMECELRIWKPSFIFISIENRYAGRTVEGYEQYLRRAVELAMDHGTVPFLATKADNWEGDHRYNYAIARVAYEYDLPLWNFWLAV
ncbi:MAG: hypothetical protein PVI78_07400, partial [Anaerolineales bacterium]